MQFITIIAIVGIVLYFLVKLGLILLRPFFLSKLLNEIEELYKKTQSVLTKDVKETTENLNKWHAQDKVVQIHSSKEDLEARIQEKQKTQEHCQAIHEKFLRLKERFIHNPSKLADAIVIYKRYLEMKLLQNQSAHAHTLALTSGSVTFDEFQSSARESMIALDEIEKKIDNLLKEP